MLLLLVFEDAMFEDVVPSFLVVSVSSLNTEAIFNIERILFIIGPTSLTTGMASFTTPSVFEAPFKRLVKLKPLVPVDVLPRPNNERRPPPPADLA